jgi:hypothetical protein
MLQMRVVSASSIDRKKYLLTSNLWTVRVIRAIPCCAYCQRWSSPLVVAPYRSGPKAALNVLVAEEGLSAAPGSNEVLQAFKSACTRISVRLPVL